MGGAEDVGECVAVNHELTGVVGGVGGGVGNGEEVLETLCCRCVVGAMFCVVVYCSMV